MSLGMSRLSEKSELFEIDEMVESSSLTQLPSFNDGAARVMGRRWHGLMGVWEGDAVERKWAGAGQCLRLGDEFGWIRLYIKLNKKGTLAV